MNGEILFSSISLTLRRQISLSSVKNGVRNQRVRELDFSVKWSISFCISLPPKILHEQVKGFDFEKRDPHGANIAPFSSECRFC